jgi:hypothetical protein
MTSLIKKFKTDSGKENNGVAIEYEANDDGTVPTIWVRRVGCTEHTKVQNRLFAPFRTHQRLKVIPAETNTQILRDAFAIGCISKWENVQNENGEPIPFNDESVCATLASLPDLYYDLTAKASDIDNYKADSLEVIAKN